MKKLLFILLTLNLTIIQGYTQTWNIKSIPDSLKKNADAIIRTSSTTYNRTSIKNSTITIREVITVLHEEGANAAQLVIHYNQNSKVTEFKGFVYNEHGNLIRKISKKKDLNDYANSSGLFSDDRIKQYKYSTNTYPYTVEYIYTVEQSEFLGIPTWKPHQWYDIAVQKAILTFRTLPSLDINYRELNHEFHLSKGLRGGKKYYRWNVSNLKAISYEKLSPDYLDIFPSVFLAPNEMSYEGSTGNFNTWKGLGKWNYDLVKNRDEISEETLNELKKLTEGISDKKEKVKAVYQYMQGKTRYVYVGLGIGGYQPTLANEVDSKGYGDCKGLSNYTKSLLKAVGIHSEYVIIGNGQRRIKFKGFSSPYQMNHAILCVPMEKDTTWLECTSQNIPFGYIGGGNSDRYALLVTEDGGVLVKTPTYEMQANLRKSTINVSLSENGEANIQANWNFKNYLYEMIGGLSHTSSKEQKKYLLERVLKSDGLTISDFSIKDISKQEAEASLNLNAKIGSYARKSGSMLFVEPNFLYQSGFLNHISSKRKQDLYQAIGYVYQDDLHIKIPEGFKVNDLPENKELSSTYGKYNIKYQKTEGKILITRSIQINKGTFEKEYFEEINAFLKAMSKQDKTKILLVKQ